MVVPKPFKSLTLFVFDDPLEELVADDGFCPFQPDAARTVSLPANWVEKGCFQDNSSRVLTYQAWSGKSDSTLESCSAQCASLGYTIAGAEYGSECFCGNEFVGGPVAIDSGRCNMPCAGNGGSQCGGSFALTVASLSS